MKRSAIWNPRSAFGSTRLAAGVELARGLARRGRPETALELLHDLTLESPRATVPRALEISLLRHLGRTGDARERAQKVHVVDPTSSFVRYELERLGQPDPALWTHLGADANRVLDLVDQYLSFAAGTTRSICWSGNIRRLNRHEQEPGAVSPNQSPLIAYYRGYVRAKMGASPAADFDRARSLPTSYVFPSRRSSYDVLNEALKATPSDGTAQFLLGSLYLSSGLVHPAIESWQRVRTVRPQTPVLHRNLGLALLQRSDYAEARTVLQEGVAVDVRTSTYISRSMPR